MRKVGKYEKMRKQALLQTYITSLLCLVLCVTMFFGTTAAWFTDTTTSQGNQIYVGKLEVELKHATFSAGVQQKGNDIMDAVTENYQVFKTIDNGGIRWEPGYTAVEKFELTENGDLAFNYQMGMECEIAENTYGTIPEKEAIANAITVWNYVGTKAEETVSLPANFNELTALDVDADGKADWERVDTLYNVITNHKPVFKGQMDKTTVTATKTEGEGENQTTVPAPAKAYHMIALHMDETFSDASVQGKTLDNLTIKLVANQLPSEVDAFGSEYDNLIYVATEDQLRESVANAEDGVTICVLPGTYDLTEKPLVINKAITLQGESADNKPVLQFVTGNGTNGATGNFAGIEVQSSNVVLKDLKLSVDPSKVSSGNTVTIAPAGVEYYSNITIDGCEFTGSDHSIAMYGNNVTIKNCILDESTAADQGNIIYVWGTTGNLTIQNNTLIGNNQKKHGISFTNGGTVDGNILVEGNVFRNVYKGVVHEQHMDYKDVSVEVLNNTFEDCKKKPVAIDVGKFNSYKVNGNVFKNIATKNEPLLDNGANAVVNADGNYWDSAAPDWSTVITNANITVQNYYTNAAKTNLVNKT